MSFLKKKKGVKINPKSTDIDLHDGGVESIKEGKLGKEETKNLFFFQFFSIFVWKGKCKTAEKLNLSGNKLTELPSDLGEMNSLRELSCSSNNLKGLPSSISKLKNLKKVDLSSNKLFVFGFPNALLELQLLTNLDISGNELSSLPPNFTKLDKLSYLNLS